MGQSVQNNFSSTNFTWSILEYFVTYQFDPSVNFLLIATPDLKSCLLPSHQLTLYCQYIFCYAHPLVYPKHPVTVQFFICLLAVTKGNDTILMACFHFFHYTSIYDQLVDYTQISFHCSQLSPTSYEPKYSRMDQKGFVEDSL